MKVVQKFPFLLGSILIVLIQIIAGCSAFNSFQREGELTLEPLEEQVTVLRDEKGMPYIYAQNIDDLMFAQGFVTAQDRLFLMELTRLFAEGRISELAGEKARKLKTRKEAYPLEFKLAGIEPGLWTIEDSLAILYFMGWNSAANLKSEVVTQMLVEKLGTEKAEEIFPLNINPDDPDDIGPDDIKGGGLSSLQQPFNLNLISDKFIASFFEDRQLEIGSNNWAVAPDFSPNGKPVVANDPHLKSSILPGPWYPCGLITPDLRAVGVIIPGLPGMIIGRTDHFAIGATNAYGDAQDLYVETIDPENPDHYLEGDVSIPFDVIEETLRIKDSDSENGYKEENIKIRLTKRGPVVSDVLTGLETEKLLSARWSAFEDMQPSLGLTRLLDSKTVYDIREALGDVTTIALNFVFADTEGNIGWQTSGRLPVRSKGNGIVPFVVKDGKDNWNGRIPFDEMPSSINPKKGWVGTCNHKTVAADFPYYYSSHLSPSYRYRRLKQLLNEPGIKTADDHWNFQRDTLNLMAKDITPVMAEALSSFKETEDMGKILSDWDYNDDIDKAGPAVFQTVYKEFAMLVFKDELGETLSKTMLDNWYFWQERLGKMVTDGESDWFDNVNTINKKESMTDLFRQAALIAKEKTGERLGDDPESWEWGDLHKMEFVSPIRRKGFGKGLLGGGAHPAPGSGEVLYRGIYKFSDPYNVLAPASLRMVADLGDKDKILA
ncbi:MAG: penicillin acylase family protein, partial [Deltaproteobacteria bacterium]|nr:penicillin acylase family protein [Deltaproteobacteria bacterium]